MAEHLVGNCSLDKKIRILVAEEDPGFLKMIEDSLKASGSLYHIEKVSSGKECLTKLQNEKFDILLLDHSLPDGEGLNWLRQFNELGVAIPTIFVTATGDPKLAIEVMKEGVFDYINRSAECAKAFPFVVNRAIEGHGLMLEKVRLQKELIETKNFLESIVEKAGDAISVVDLEEKILYWNEGAEKIYGYKREEVWGKKLSEFLYPRDENLRAEEEKVTEKLMTRVKAGEVLPNVEVKRQTKDGKEIIVSMTISPLRSAEGRIVGASRICKDITDLKKAEERLVLAERLSSLGELTAGVAHELRNPLAGIKINTQILSRKKDLPEMEKKLLNSTQEGIEKIQKIVEDMLHFAKPKPSHFKEEDINEVVKGSMAVLQTKLKKGNISPVFEERQGLPKVRIDIHQIQQVLINLMLNAMQAMERGGTLTIRTFAEDEGGVGVEVRDTGVGIPRPHLKKIFDPFFTTKSEGTGLGLSISLKILENHGATIDVVSEEGRGSTFTIHFTPSPSPLPWGERDGVRGENPGEREQ
ncbi:MAG TPA: PAS domain S-box protein [Thermodesulfobacteriota bacterium]|nr:PAS domain S-box protein [Thermodesulfobacteriota bacterium]